MAALSTEERRRVGNHLMRQAIAALPGTVSKPELRAAVDATDTWIDTNQSVYNLALPQPFRGQASTELKTLLFCYVAMRRAGLLRVEEDLV